MTHTTTAMASPHYKLIFYIIIYNIYVLIHCILYAAYLVNYTFLVFFHLLSHGILFVIHAFNRESIAILKKK